MNLKQNERDAFEVMCADAVNMHGPSSTLDQILERVLVSLKSRKETWATVLARYHQLRRTVYNALCRLRDRHLIDQGPNDGTHTTWRPHLTGHTGIMLIDDPYEAVTPVDPEKVRDWYTRDLLKKE